MAAFKILVFLLGVSVASCVNFTIVYEWKEMDFAWPTEASRRMAIQDGTFNPENIYPRSTAVYKDRLFFTLFGRRNSTPATLVSLPTSSANSALPKLAPFPNWHFHKQNSCDSIHSARGIEVDTNKGHLWVVDADSRSGCKPKLWIFDLNDGDKTILVHHFDSSISWDLRDIVIDQTPDNKQFGYITEWEDEYIVVFDRDENKSWKVETPGKLFLSLALSHREQERRLYLGRDSSNEIYSVSVTDLRSGNRTAPLNFIGKWESEPYRMTLDRANVMYAAFEEKDFILTWNISEPFSQQRFYQVNDLNTVSPFTFALDAAGTFWMTERNNTDRKSRHKLLKAEVSASSYFAPSAVFPGPSSTTPGPALKRHVQRM